MPTNNTNLPAAVINSYETAYNRYITTPRDNMQGIYTSSVQEKDTLEDFWLGPVGQVRENPNAPKYAKLTEHKATLTTKQYKADGFRYDRAEVIDRNVAQFAARTRQVFERCAAYPDKAVALAIEAGESGKAWDGENYFSNVVSGVRENDNLLTRTGTGTLQNIATDIDNVRTAFRRFTVEGEAAGVSFDTLLVPPELETKFRTILVSAGNVTPQLNANVVNPVATFSPTWRLVVSDHLTSKTDWYAFDSRLTPMIWVTQSQREGNGYVQIRLIEDDSKWQSEDYIGVAASIWGGVGYGHPIAAIKVKA